MRLACGSVGHCCMCAWSLPLFLKTQLSSFLQMSYISPSALRTLCLQQIIKYGSDQATRSGFGGLCSAWESVKSLVTGSFWFPASPKDPGEAFASHLGWKCIRGSVKSLLIRTWNPGSLVNFHNKVIANSQLSRKAFWGEQPGPVHWVISQQVAPCWWPSLSSFPLATLGLTTTC